MKRQFLYYPIISMGFLFVFGIVYADSYFVNSGLLVVVSLFALFSCFFIRTRSAIIHLLCLFFFCVGVLHGGGISDGAGTRFSTSDGSDPDPLLTAYIDNVEYENGRTKVIVSQFPEESGYKEKILLYVNRKLNLIKDQKIQFTSNLNPPENWNDDFDYVSYLARKGIFLVGEIDTITIVGHKESFVYYLDVLNHKIIGISRSLFGEPYSSLLLGLVTGYRAEFSKDFEEQLSRTGTTHIVAISGFNISLIVSLIMDLRRYLGKRISILLTVGISIAFCIITGMSPPVLRATIMALTVIIAQQLGRESNPIILLVLSAIVMAFLNPNVLWDISFQLSFLSTAGLVCLFPFLDSESIGFPEFLKDSLLQTIVAFVATFPVIVYYFKQISLLTFLSNLLVIPAVSLSTVLGLLVVLVGLISFNLAYLMSFIVYIPLWYIIIVINVVSKIPFGVISFEGSLKQFYVFAYYLVIFFVLQIVLYRRSRVKDLML